MKDTTHVTIREMALKLWETFEHSSVRKESVDLIWHLLLGMPMTQAQVEDFGVRNEDHYDALLAVVRTDADISLLQIGEELDQAMCHGQRLTALIRKYAPDFRSLEFTTFWDEIGT